MSATESARQVRIWLCGGLRIEVDDRRVEDRLGRRKSRELLALLVDRSSAVGREELVELLWPESPPGSRTGQLRVLLTELRRWIDERRSEIEALELEAIEALAAASLSEPGHAAEAIVAARRLVSRAPFRESGYSLLMRALVAEGNPAQALEAYGRLRLLLREELGTIPSVALTALHVWVLEQSQERATAEEVEPETRYACRPDGINIAFQVLGDGPVDFVIVPGFMSHLDMQWANPAYRSWLRRLSSSQRVITLDKAGTGASDNVPCARTMEDWAADVLAVLDEVRSARPVLLGMSEGAAVAVGFAAAHPDRVRAVVFYGAMARALPKLGYLWEHRDVIQATMDSFAVPLPLSAADAGRSAAGWRHAPRPRRTRPRARCAGPTAHLTLQRSGDRLAQRGAPSWASSRSPAMRMACSAPTPSSS